MYIFIYFRSRRHVMINVYIILISIYFSKKKNIIKIDKFRQSYKIKIEIENINFFLHF